MRWNGKVSGWFYGVMLFIAAVLIPLLILSVTDRKYGVLIFVFAVFAATELFCFSIAVRNYVLFEGDSMLIVFGFIKKRILYREIQSAVRLTDWSSSLAASFDRVMITYKDGKTVMLALADNDAFCEALMHKRQESRV